jgi:hypothetical protein
MREVIFEKKIFFLYNPILNSNLNNDDHQGIELSMDIIEERKNTSERMEERWNE